MLEIKKFAKEYKKLLIVLTLILVVVLLIYNYLNKNANIEYKIYKSEDVVYTKKIDKDEYNYTLKLPYINIKGEPIKKVNKDIMNLYYRLLAMDEQTMDYKYYLNKDILSLLIYIDSKEIPGIYPDDVIIYNVNIKNGMVVNNDWLFSKFNVDEDLIVKSINEELKKYYDYEIEKEYIDNTLTFDNYVKNKNIFPLDDLKFYIKNNVLYAYKLINFDVDFAKDNEIEKFSYKIKDL